MVKLARLIYDTEYCESVTISDSDGREIAVISAVGDGYGCGVNGGHLSSGYKWLWDGDDL
jgi:hypothetical protein